MLAAFGTGQVFLSMLYFFLFFIWIMLLFRIFSDVFRSDDLSGWGKALWCIFVVFLPFIGVFTYLIARGRKMTDHVRDDAYLQEEAFRGYIRDEMHSVSQNEGDQLSMLASLKASGAIDEEEFQRLRTRVSS